MISRVIRQPFTIVFAVLFGLVSAPLLSIGIQSVLDLYDKAFPVVTMTGELVRADNDEVIIRISGVKHRQCTYLRVQALTRDPYGNMSDARLQRTDVLENSDTKAPGRYFAGEWRIWPRGDAVAVVVNTNHLCSDRVVVTKIADVKL